MKLHEVKTRKIVKPCGYYGFPCMWKASESTYVHVERECVTIYDYDSARQRLHFGFFDWTCVLVRVGHSVVSCSSHQPASCSELRCGKTYNRTLNAQISTMIATTSAQHSSSRDQSAPALIGRLVYSTLKTHWEARVDLITVPAL